MAAPANEYAFDLAVAAAAADRWASRAAHHAKFERAVRNKQYSELDTPVRRAARANHLLGKLQAAAPAVAAAVAGEFREAFADAAAVVTPETVSDAFLERVIGATRDFQFVEFLDKAIFASRSVGRVVTKLADGRRSFGTGFLVSPHLLLTNHHVLPAADVAARSAVEFDFQRDRLGRDLGVRPFDLDPATFFLTDKGLDFALVALSPAGAGRPLGDYMWCPLRKDAGKIVVGEPINIVQHPLGERKQVVIRENRLLDAFDGADLFYHYGADTEPGSSGSPVFNDQWEVVALHHSGVPKRNSKGEFLDTAGKVWKEGDDPARLEWVANEGVRASKLVEFIAKAAVPGAGKRLVKELLDATPPAGDPMPVTRPVPRPETHHQEDQQMADRTTTPAGSMTVTVPLYITVSLGAPGGGPTVAVAGPAVTADDETRLEKVEIDPDFAHRRGYDPTFLGFAAPFPKLTAVSRPKAFALPGVTGDGRFVLKYHHYSLLFNKARKLAFVAGVNFDPTAEFTHKRDKKDEWFFDPRVVPQSVQAGESLYADNPLDRGHLVRRADAGWGRTAAEAKLANDDTFHFTNCSPQHAITNQGRSQIEDHGRLVKAPPGLKLWGKLEDHIAAQGEAGARKLSVFNGPVFRPDDQVYRGVLIPREFWKVVVFATDAGAPAAVAFVLSQAALIAGLREEFEVGEYKAVQVRVADLEAKTDLNFGPFRDWDVFEHEGREERFTGDYAAVVLNSVKDVVL